MKSETRYLIFSGLTKAANDSGAKNTQSYWLPPGKDRAEFEAAKRESLAARITKNTMIYWSHASA
jgi:hypothetical protein